MDISTKSLFTNILQNHKFQKMGATQRSVFTAITS